MTTRGGDFDLHIGQDVSIGYSSHTDTAVRLYLQETLEPCGQSGRGPLEIFETQVSCVLIWIT